MNTITYTICYRNLKQSRYIRIAEVRIARTIFAEEACEMIFGIFNGQEKSVWVKDVKYFYNPQSIRSMSIGDIIEVSGECSFTCIDQGFQQDTYSRECAYPLYYSVAEQLLMGIDYDRIAERRASR